MGFSSSLAVVAQPLPVSEQLEAARQIVESRFLRAGEVLGQAVEGVSVLIKSLDRLAETLDPATVDATTSELNAAAALLLELPAQHAGRRGTIAQIRRHGEALGECIEGMRRNLAYLRVFAINIKITAGGIAAAGAEFGMFAQEIYDRIETGREQLRAFSEELAGLQEKLVTALEQEAALAQHCEGLLPAVPDGLAASSAEIVAHHQQVARAAAEVGALTRAVQKKVGAALGALQVGDSTRQRIEHVQQALGMLTEVRGFAAEPQGRLEAFIHGLLARQLEAAGADFGRDVARIGQSMAGIASDASEILRLRDLAFGRTADGQGFLKRMEGHVGQAVDLVDHLERAGEGAAGLGRAAGAAAADLSARIAGLQAIKTDVQQMALNTTLKCSRIGDAGKPLAVIAVELRLHAGHLETSAQDAFATLAELSGQASGLSTEAGGEGAATALADAAGRLRRAGDAVESDLAGLARQGEAVVGSLRQAAERLDLQREIGAVLDETAAALSMLAGEDVPAVDDLAEPLSALLEKIAKTYTMAQEREVHRAYAAHVAAAPQAEAAANADDEDVFF